MENLNHLAFFCSVSLLVLYTVPLSDALKTLEERIYVTFNASIPCFRLTDATHQIGCSASSTNTRGVLHYVDSSDELDWLVDKGPHGPYVALLEPDIFSSSNVRRLKSSSRVNGIIVRYEGSNTTIPQGLEGFSPERKCPNAGYGFGDDSCEPWNLNGTSLAFSDFGDFPVFALHNENFVEVLECFSRHNSNGSGTFGDYPLCSVELTADMYAVRDTVTCFRRAEKVLTLLANEEGLCDPLGDDNVWGTLFPVTAEPQDNSSIILLTTKIDSTAFFPALAHGANNELAGIATLVAVLEQLGKLKKDGSITGTQRPIMYAFFHGESWDYIGSSRMVYDMERGTFPDFDPPLMMKHIGDYLELSQLGIQSMTTDTPTFYVHSTVTSDIVESLNSTATTSGKIILKPSTNTCYNGKQPCKYPPASLQRFLRKNSEFNGSVLADFDTHYNYQFFGSRFDSRSVFTGDTTFDDSTYNQTIQNLANLATVIANTLLNVSGPVWSDSPQNVTASTETVRQVIDCFLVDAGCDLFQTVFIRNLADPLLDLSEPPGRYITVDTQSNLETALIFQMVAYFTGVNLTDQSEVISCKECLQQMEGKTYNISWMQGPGSNTLENCLCLNSSTFFHIAKSPAFEMKDYNSREYSTWAESRWTAVSLRMYLITYPLQEAALLLCGLAMTLLSLLIGLQCNRKGRKVFEPNPAFLVQ